MVDVGVPSYQQFRNRLGIIPCREMEWCVAVVGLRVDLRAMRKQIRRNWTTVEKCREL